MSEEDSTPISYHDFFSRRSVRSFQAEYLGTFIEDEHTETLQEIARRYHERCDTYDAQVCTGWGKDGPLPANLWESRLINRHARYVIELLSQQCHLPREAIFRAIQRSLREDDEERKEYDWRLISTEGLERLSYHTLYL